MTDRELLDRYYTDRDNAWLGILLPRYTLLLLGVCMKYVKDEEEAKDCVQQIFVKVITELAKYRVEYFKSWIYTIARNHCLMQLRAENRVKIHAVDPESVQIAETWHLNDKIEKEQQLDQLESCMETLSADQQTVIRLFYLQNKSYREIETFTGMDWNKVRSLIQNGRRNLKICMQGQEKSTHERYA